VISVIFDMDGLMLDTERVEIIACKAAADELGYDLTEDVILSTVGRTSRDTERIFGEHLGPSFSYSTLRDAWRVHTERLFVRDGVHQKAGLLPLLDLLDEHAVLKAVATQTRRAQAIQRLERAGIFARFSHIVGGDEIVNGKPAPDILWKAAEKMGSRAEDCFVLEDSEAGILAAHAAGMRPILVPDMKPPGAEIAALAEHVFPSLLQVRDHFELILSAE
jgi:HAD superfamily hydrolase (TIGR01509 family)